MGFLGSKAETLNALSILPLYHSEILPLIYFSFVEWESKRETCLEKLNVLAPYNSLIIRSSSTKEDTLECSNAGAYLSLPNIPLCEADEAIDRVFNSYSFPNPTDQVLIQPMLETVVSSGVAFSHDPESLAPYRIISWSTKNQTDNITKGSKEGKTFFSHRSKTANEPKAIEGILNVLHELESYYPDQPLDIEFAITETNNQRVIWLLQLRLLVNQKSIIRDIGHTQKLNQVDTLVSSIMKAHTKVKGKTTILGVMPDWNPAEMIGLKPKPLAKSLYRTLITDRTWAVQRNDYGYRDMTGFPLMIELEGLPYIDTRLSFNSLIPKELSEEIAEKLVNFYMKKLGENPSFHDKIEFNVVFSCYTFDLKDKLHELLNYGFTEVEIENIHKSLVTLTRNIINPQTGLMALDAKKFLLLKQKRERVMASKLATIEKIQELITDCRNYGTLPFAGLARSGFIAVQLLNSLVSKDILSTADIENFRGSIKTVTSQLSEDLNTLNLTKFLKIYGHLRPGTYDILSPSYGEKPNLYFGNKCAKVSSKSVSQFQFKAIQLKKIKEYLEASKLSISTSHFLEFVRKAIELRERSKFEFTKNLSLVLSLIKKLGSENGLSTSELAFLSIDDIMQIKTLPEKLKYTLIKSIETGKISFQNSASISLPPVILNTNQIWQFEQPDISPNYITTKTITAPVTDVSKKSELSGSIVCIEAADPGYDWLFSHNIGGLVTAWGGINSHMAIRASEMKIPSIVGVGEKIFNEFKNAKYVSLDCGSQGYTVLR